MGQNKTRKRHVVICNEGVYLASEMKQGFTFDRHGAATLMVSSPVQKIIFMHNPKDFLSFLHKSNIL